MNDSNLNWRDAKRRQIEELILQCPLPFNYIFPTTGLIPDLHRLETRLAGRTIEPGNST